MYSSAPTVWQPHQVRGSAPRPCRPRPRSTSHQVTGPGSTLHPGARMHPGRRPPDRPGRRPPRPPHGCARRTRRRRTDPPHAHAVPVPMPARRPPGPGWGSPVGGFAFTSPYVWLNFFWVWVVLGCSASAGFPQVAVGCSVDCCGCFWAVVVCAGGVGLSRVGVSPAFAVAQLGCASPWGLAPHCCCPGSPRPFPPKLIRGSTRQIRRHYQKALSRQHTSHLPHRQGPDRSSGATSVVLGSQDVSPVIPGVGAATDSVTTRSPAVCWCWGTLCVLLPSWLLGSTWQ